MASHSSFVSHFATPKAWLVWLLHAILPSFISDLVSNEKATAARQRRHKIRSTSHLDGLRGIACLVVFLFHYTEWNHPYFIPSYGGNEPGDVSSPMQLPMVRVVYAGRPMVHVFFVVSGIALSYGPMRAVHARDLPACHAALASAALRRPIRLFGPCLVSTFAIAVLMQLGYMYEPAPGLGDQLVVWRRDVLYALTWPWTFERELYPYYNVHLWTIPFEFIHSMLLFLVILTFSPLKRVARFVGYGLLLPYFLVCGKWAAFEFIFGMIYADFYTYNELQQQELVAVAFVGKKPNIAMTRLLRIFKKILLFIILIPPLFVAGWPNYGAETTPGIRKLLQHTPDAFVIHGPDAIAKFWFCLSAPIIIYSLSHIGFTKKALESPFSQYLGRISYAMYIVHGPAMVIIKDAVMGEAARPSSGVRFTDNFVPMTRGSGVRGLVGIETPLQRMVAWVCGLVVLAPPIIWSADLFWRLVDMPIIKFAKIFEAWCL